MRLRRGAAAPKDPQRRLLLGVGLAFVAFLVFFPAKQLVAQHLRIERLESRLEALSDGNRKLQAEAKRLEDASELELLARERLGLVNPGEQVYVFVPTPPPAPVKAEPEPSWWSKAWNAVVRIVRGNPG